MKMIVNWKWPAVRADQLTTRVPVPIKHNGEASRDLQVADALLHQFQLPLPLFAVSQPLFHENDTTACEKLIELFVLQLRSDQTRRPRN